MSTMRAVVLDEPGPPEVLHVTVVPRPEPASGEILIKVEAFGLNRSELHFRRGVGSFGSFPRIPGLEAVGTVAVCPGGEIPVGTQVAALMGGMGRTIDGGYAEYLCVPVGLVVPFSSDLPWHVLGAVPEMLQTAAGSLRVGLDARPGQSLLVRGGTSSVGLALAVLGHAQGMTVLSTTRNPARAAALTAVGVDHVIIDDGAIAAEVRRLFPDGVDNAVELVGTATLPDTLRATRIHGTVCFTGMLSDVWTIPDFYPMDVIPNGVRLSSYSGDSADLTGPVLQGFLDQLAAGRVTLPIGRVYDMDDIVAAHTDMEAGTVTGKLVVRTR